MPRVAPRLLPTARVPVGKPTQDVKVAQQAGTEVQVNAATVGRLLKVSASNLELFKGEARMLLAALAESIRKITASNHPLSIACLEDFPPVVKANIVGTNFSAADEVYTLPQMRQLKDAADGMGAGDFDAATTVALRLQSGLRHIRRAHMDNVMRIAWASSVLA